jgi:DNA translocase FtsK/SpoIIIE-like protein
MGRRHSSTTSARATGGGASRASTYLPPWLVWLALPLLGGIFWALASAGTAAAVAVGALLAVGSTVLTVHTYTVFARRKDARVRWDAAITVGLACLWVLATAMFGLFHNPHVDVWPALYRIPELVVKAFTLPIWGTWLGGGILVAVAWNIRRAAMTPPAEEDKRENESPLERALDGAKMKAIEANAKGQITGRLEADRGRQDSGDLQKLASGIESAQKLREGAVRIAKDPKDRGAASFVITPHDPLELDVTWPGPSLPGGHLADAPIPFSIAEDGELAVIWFNGDEDLGRNLVHFLVEGANGSGKSMGWRAAIADALTRTAGAGVRLHGVDVSGKWRQTFGPLIRYMTSLATDAKTAKKTIRELSKYIADKQERMGAAGHTQWSKACGEPFDVFWLEEGSEIAAESQELTRAAERWRSAGAMLIIVIQRASWDNIDTTTRSQLGGATAYGVNDGGQNSNSFALPSVAIDQGADPSRWGSRHPGRHYLVTSTTPEERMAIPHKSFKTSNDEIAAALAQHCEPLRTDDGQPLPGFSGATTYDQQNVAGPARAAAADDTDFDEQDDEEMTPIPADPDPTIVVDPSQPIQPPTPDQDLPMSVPGTGGPKISKDDFRALIQQHLRAIRAGGRERTQAADVHRMRPETGYSREEVRKELVRLCEGPHTDLDVFRLRRDDADRLGVYEIYAAEPAYAG